MNTRINTHQLPLILLFSRVICICCFATLMFLSRLFAFNKSQPLYRASIHESGHVVMAYTYGHFCNDVAGDGEGGFHTQYLFQGTSRVIEAIQNIEANPELYGHLWPEEKALGPEVGLQLMSILAAGSFAEWIFADKKTPENVRIIDIKSPDQAQMMVTDRFLRHHHPQYSIHLVEGQLLHVGKLLAYPPIRRAVEALHQVLIRDGGIDRNGIEACFRKCGFWRLLTM